MGGSFVGKEQDATKGVYAQAGTCTAVSSPVYISDQGTLKYGHINK